MRCFYYCLLQLFLCLNYFGQNYFDYQRIFNRIDEDVELNRLDVAAVRLDSVYQQYDFIYARHCIKALQICAGIQDSSRAEKWLQQSFKQGVPLWMIRTNELTDKVLLYHNSKKVLEDYDSLRAYYFNSINDSIAHIIDSLLATDQRLTEKVNDGFIVSRGYNYLFCWKKNNKKSFAAIYEIMQQRHFPGERLIGLPSELQDSVQAYKHYKRYGPGSVLDHRAYTMLIHYFSNKRDTIDNILYENISTGYLPAYQYGALNDFMSKYGKGNKYYNVWHTDKDTTKLDEINERRAAIGLNSYQRQQESRTRSMERRKDKLANSTIMPE